VVTFFLYSQIVSYPPMPRKKQSRKSIPKRSRRKSAKKTLSRRKRSATTFRAGDDDARLAHLLGIDVSWEDANSYLHNYREYTATPPGAGPSSSKDSTYTKLTSELGLSDADAREIMQNIDMPTVAASSSSSGSGPHDDELAKAIKLSLNLSTGKQYYRLTNAARDASINAVTGKVSPASGIRGNGNCFVNAFRLGYIAIFGDAHPITFQDIISKLESALETPKPAYQHLVEPFRNELQSEIAAICGKSLNTVHNAEVLAACLAHEFQVNIILKAPSTDDSRTTVERVNVGEEYKRGVIRMATNLAHFELYLDKIPDSKSWHAAYREIWGEYPSEPGLNMEDTWENLTF